jgi:predicted DNA-binding transcriptional regulator YafY
MTIFDKDAICQAIAERRVIQFRYKFKTRTVEPHMVGWGKDGVLTLSGWQLSGGSGMAFRDFHLDKLTELYITRQTFEQPRPGYNPDDPGIPRKACRL